MNIEELQSNDPEVAARLKRLKEKLGIEAAPGASTAAEVVDSIVAEPEAEKMPGEDQQPEEFAVAAPKEITGQDVDWSNFDLDPNLAHLYPLAKFTPTLEGPKWVALLEVIEFESAEFKVSKAAQKQGKKSLGDITTERINGSERWRIATVLSSGPGFGTVMFTRTVKIVLPDPRELRTEAELPAAPTDPELQQAEDAALGWIEEQGQEQEKQADILTDLVNLTPAEIAAAKPAAEPVLFNPDGTYTKEQAAANAAGVEAPSTEQVAGACLNEPTARVPLGWGLSSRFRHATDGEGSVLPTTFQIPAVDAEAAGLEAAKAMMGPDFETEEGTVILDNAQPLEQIKLPLEGEQQ